MCVCVCVRGGRRQGGWGRGAEPCRRCGAPLLALNLDFASAGRDVGGRATARATRTRIALRTVFHGGARSGRWRGQFERLRARRGVLWISRCPCSLPGPRRPGKEDALGDSANTVKLWARRSSIANEINLHRTNTQYADGVVFSENVTSSASVEECLDGAGVVVIAVPGTYLHPLLDKMPRARTHSPSNPVIVSLVKSLHFDENAQRFSTMCEDIQQVVNNAGANIPVVALSGPNLYAEMLRNEFAEATIGYANGDRAAAMHVQRCLRRRLFAHL